MSTDKKDIAAPETAPTPDPFEIVLKSLKLTGDATVLHKPGAVRLDDYPHLVYAPSQHGKGIWLEDGTASVEDIASAAAETPDYAALAVNFRTTPEHVADAIRYAVEAGAATAGE